MLTNVNSLEIYVLMLLPTLRTQMLQLLITGLSDFEVDPVGNSVSHATHPHQGLAGLVPLLCPAALAQLAVCHANDIQACEHRVPHRLGYS